MAPDRTPRIAAVVHQPDAPLGRFARALDACPVERFDVTPDEVRDLDVGAFDGLISLGGEMGAHETDRYPWMGAELALLQATHAAGVPIFGVCLGGQLLARALGATPRPSGCREVGWLEVEVEADDPVLGGRGRRKQFQWHYDAFGVPPGGELVARGHPCHNQAFRAGRSYGVQFHPEVGLDLLEMWSSSERGRAQLEHAGIDAAELVEQAAALDDEQERQARKMMNGFVALVRDHLRAARV